MHYDIIELPGRHDGYDYVHDRSLHWRVLLQLSDDAAGVAEA